MCKLLSSYVTRCCFTRTRNKTLDSPDRSDRARPRARPTASQCVVLKRAGALRLEPSGATHTSARRMQRNTCCMSGFTSRRACGSCGGLGEQPIVLPALHARKARVEWELSAREAFCRARLEIAQVMRRSPPARVHDDAATRWRVSHAAIRMEEGVHGRLRRSRGGGGHNGKMSGVVARGGRSVFLLCFRFSL